MGGMGFIENNKALCMLSVLINTHLAAGRARGEGRSLLLRQQRVCLQRRQAESKHVVPLKEADAYPAMPEDGYGWEKLFSERMCRHFREGLWLTTRVARFHNVYGPNGTWDGGREKAPAAICRKIINAIETGQEEIEIWGDGKQTRSFMYIDDCVEGIDKIMHSDIEEPLNLGSDELTTINGLVEMVEDIAGVEFKHKHNLRAQRRERPQQRQHAHQEAPGWAPGIRLDDGMEKTYRWIYDEMTSGRTSVVNAVPQAAMAAP